jgi:serine/threonine-protein kinase
MLIGTPGYMPPEQYHGADPHPSADIYALGMVTLEMLTGANPPREPEPLPIRTLRTGDPARDAVVDVIEAATAYDAAARPSATALLAHPALRMLLDLPGDPADPIVVVDEFPPMPPVPSAAERPTMPHPQPPPPAPPTPIPTLEETVHHPLPAGARGGVMAPVLLIALGLLGLLASAWLLVG